MALNLAFIAALSASFLSEAGSKVEFDKVLLVDNEGTITLGAPAIEGALITAEVIEHVKGDKVIVFRKKNGHRQSFTAITISGINLPSAKKEKKETKEKTEA